MLTVTNALLKKKERKKEQFSSFQKCVYSCVLTEKAAGVVMIRAGCVCLQLCKKLFSIQRH